MSPNWHSRGTTTMPPIQGFFIYWGFKTLKLISMESSLSFLLWPLNPFHHWVGFRVYTWSMAHWNLKVLIGPLICFGLLLRVHTRMVRGHNPSEMAANEKLNPHGILHGQNGSCWPGNWECRGNFQFASNHLNYSNILYEFFPTWSWRKFWTRAVLWFWFNIYI